MPGRIWLIRIALLSLTMMLAAAQAVAGLSERTDPQREIELGRQVAAEIEKKDPLTSDKAVQDRVQRIGAALTDQLEPKLYPYEFKVLTSPEINAFSLPGGFVYVCEGLLTRMKDDDSLAFIISHEMAHAAHRHWAEHVNKMSGTQVLGTIVSIFGGDIGSIVASLAVGLQSLKYSRDQENDADKTGLEYMWKAGYDTKGALDAMQIIVELEAGKSVPKYLRSHPPGKERLKRLQEQCEALKSQLRPVDTSASPPPQEIDVSRAAGDTSAIAIAPNPWFPLAVGDEWTYSVQGGDGRSSYMVRIVSAIRIRDNAVYRAETSFGDNAIPCQLLTTAAEVWRRNRPTSPESQWRVEYILDTPSQESAERGGWQYTLLGSEQIALPCGTFPESLKIRKQSGEPISTFDIWFVRGIGMVKRVCAETGVTETLIGYKVLPGTRTP